MSTTTPDLQTMTMTELIQLQTKLAEAIKQRFERSLALMFTDIVGSTPYFSRFGDVAGRQLQQRHYDLLKKALAAHDGRVVDTAGDGAFSCCPSVEAAANVAIDLDTELMTQNLAYSADHQLTLRVGIHWGSVLTDGAVVSGDAVNVCARVASAADPTETWLTQAAFQELPSALRLRCKFVGVVPLKGVAPMPLAKLMCRNSALFPDRVLFREPGEQVLLPAKDVIAFGRLPHSDEVQGNDVVLVVADSEKQKHISRWHFELRRLPRGFVLRSVTEQPTEVDGKLLSKGDEVDIRPGSVVNVAHVLTLEFLATETFQLSSGLGDQTITAPPARAPR